MPPNFDELKESVRVLYGLLSDPQPGLSSRQMMVGENWRKIAVLWDPIVAGREV